MPIQVEFLREPEHVRVTAAGICSHGDVMSAMRYFLPHPQTAQARDIIWDLRTARLDLTTEQVQEQVKLLGFYRKQLGWGVSWAVTANAEMLPYCRMSAAYANLERLCERIYVVSTIEEALIMLKEIRQRFSAVPVD